MQSLQSLYWRQKGFCSLDICGGFFERQKSTISIASGVQGRTFFLGKKSKMVLNCGFCIQLMPRITIAWSDDENVFLAFFALPNRTTAKPSRTRFFFSLFCPSSNAHVPVLLENAG